MDHSPVQVNLYKEKDTEMLRLCTISLSPDGHHTNKLVGHKRDCRKGCSQLKANTS